MEVYLVKKLDNVQAEGVFNPKDRSIVVKAGATVSAVVSDNLDKKGGRKIKKLREENCEGLKTTCDIKFKSPTAAANFLIGMSTNGLVAWKDKEGKSIKELL